MKNFASISLIIALVGLLDSAYLTWLKITHTEAYCIGGIGDCATVNSSRYSEIRGFPIALLGLLAYIVIAGILFLETRHRFFKVNGTMLVFGFSLIGTLYSAYLSYLEATVIRAWCPFCLASAIAISMVFILSMVRLARYQPES
jgi:uncharacterized membrane protein